MPKPVTINRVPAASVPYGENICTRGDHVWVALDLDGNKLLGVYATAKEARQRHGISRPRTVEQEYESRARRYGEDSPSARRFARKHGLTREDAKP